MQNIRVIVFVVLGCFFLSACSTAPVTRPNNNKNERANITKPDDSESANIVKPDDDSVYFAERFMSNVGMGKIILDGLKKGMREQKIEDPALAVFVEKAFADAKEEDFIFLIASVYARHVSKEDLIELSRFSESPTIKRFFMAVFDKLINQQRVDDTILQQFNSVEIEEIIAFSTSSSFERMNNALPIINKELHQAGANYGRELIINYMKTL